MKVFLSATGAYEKIFSQYQCLYTLESFVSVNPAQIPLLKKSKMVMIDSGAFTFRKDSLLKMDWNEYLERYADFLKTYDMDYFFELDIDNLIGYDKVKELRQRLEKMVNKPSIPVWHVNRGMDDFLRCVQEYDYISLGGIAGAKGSEINRIYKENFSRFITIAHQNNCKIHGLGYTSTIGLRKNHFDSVDSTTWLNGSKFGNICVFKDGKIVQEHFKNKRCIDIEKLNEHNLKEWLKFQAYADAYL